MDIRRIKLLAFDLDGTLTQHKSPICPENRAVLDVLAKKYRLVMVGAGACNRIYEQLGRFPLDIIGNYGMQEAVYDPAIGDIRVVANAQMPCDRESLSMRADMLRKKYGFTQYKGNHMEFHDSGCVTFPLLGTKAELPEKLAFDPDRGKRRAIYEEVKQVFSEYTVFVGGTSSFDMAPAPYTKYYALDKYCRQLGLGHEEVVFVGDDYGPGGNDESVYRSDFHFVPIEDYRKFPEVMAQFL